jgi:hypothetical protein
MSRPQPSPTFIVPQPVHGAPSTPKVKRDAAPFVIVPASLVTEDRDLEPKWLDAIETATD